LIDPFDNRNPIFPNLVFSKISHIWYLIASFSRQSQRLSRFANANAKANANAFPASPTPMPKPTPLPLRQHQRQCQS